MQTHLRTRASIFAKVLFAPFVVILLLCTVGIWSYLSMEDVISSVTTIERRETLVDGSREIKADLLLQLAYIRDFIIFADEEALDSLEAASADLMATLDRMIATANVEETRNQFRSIQATQVEYDAILQQVESLVRRGDREQAAAVLRDEAYPKMNDMLDVADAIIVKVSRNAAETRNTVRADEADADRAAGHDGRGPGRRRGHRGGGGAGDHAADPAAGRGCHPHGRRRPEPQRAARELRR